MDINLANWDWLLWLHFLVSIFGQPHFSNVIQKPLMWVRFATAVKLGVRGGLYHHPTALVSAEFDHDSALPDCTLQLYFRIDKEDIPFLVTADGNVLNERTSATGTSASRRRNPSFAAGI
jgi:hypothetical protein